MPWRRKGRASVPDFPGRMKRFQKIAAAYLFACLFFAWGAAAVAWKVFPYGIFAPAISQLSHAIKTQRERGAPLSDALTLHVQESRNNLGRAGFLAHDPAFRDTGFLLISRFSRKQGQGIAELYSLEQRKVLHTWVPDLKEILRQTPKHQGGLNTFRDYRMQHPFLLPGGDLIIKSCEGPMARIRADGSVVWTLDHHFHHSVEQDHDGNLVVPIWLKEAVSPFAFREDGIAWVSPDGRLLKTVSLTELFLKAGRRDLLYGIGPWEEDRYHLNDCEPVLEDAGELRRGDLLLSIRNLSVVALYRPSESALLWIRTGPWLNQHDIDRLPDGRYSIFGNDVLRYSNDNIVHVNENGAAEIYLYDADTSAVETPWTPVLRREDVRTKTQGRSRVFDNGDVFVEATDTVRLLRLSRESLRWEFIPESAPGILGALHWSRYLTPEEVDLSFTSP